MTPERQNWDFFVSYTRTDRPWAEWIAWELEAAGYDALVQAWDFGPGSNWVQRIQDGVTRAARTVAVLSENYTKSPYCRAEWEAAWRSDPTGETRKLLTVRVEGCEREGLLASVVSVDLFDVDEAEARERLREMVTSAADNQRGKPASAPRFPGGTTIPRPESFPGLSTPSQRPPTFPVRGWGRFRFRSGWILPILALAVVVALLALLLARLQPEVPKDVTLLATPNQLVSSNSQGTPADRDSGRPSLDRSGRFVAFTSAASNLADKAGGHYNIFVKDREAGSIVLASRGANGDAANGDSQFPAICLDGRWVAFASTATNLLRGGPALAQDVWRVYVYDTLAATTQLVSVSQAGADPGADSRNPGFSADCSRVVFESTATNLMPTPAVAGQYAVYVRDLRTHATILASMAAAGGAADGNSTHATISPDGRSVAFSSWATNLTAQKADRTIPQVYIADLASHQVSTPSAEFVNSGDETLRGYSWPDFSPDGHYLIFRSITDSADPSHRGRYVFVWDLITRGSALKGVDGSPVGWSDACVSGTNNGTSFSAKISNASSSHGHRVLFTVAGPQESACQLVFRELAGPDVPVKPQQVGQEILEPALNDTGDVLSWAVAGSPQLVYACDVVHCSE